MPSAPNTYPPPPIPGGPSGLKVCTQSRPLQFPVWTSQPNPSRSRRCRDTVVARGTRRSGCRPRGLLGVVDSGGIDGVQVPGVEGEVRPGHRGASLLVIFRVGYGATVDGVGRLMQNMNALLRVRTTSSNVCRKNASTCRSTISSHSFPTISTTFLVICPVRTVVQGRGAVSIMPFPSQHSPVRPTG